MSSSQKKNSITSLADYYQLSQLYNDAQDRLLSGGTGAGWSGIHYDVMNAVRHYGKAPNSREDGMRALKELLTDYERDHLGSQEQSDEEYLRKFDEEDLE